MRKPGEYRVLIVGCGELGSRHLQAVAALPEVVEIEVVDRRPAALAIARERVEAVSDRPAGTVVRWLSSLDQVSKGGDLCIVATQARDRCAAVRAAADAGAYRSFLLEKLVSQSVDDYEDLLAFADQRGLRAWVNCKRRVYPVWQHVKAALEPGEPIVFAEAGGNHGLANNGIHGVDLFAFLDGSGRIDSAGARIDPVLHASKRGPEVFDLSGTLHGFTERGSHFTLSYQSGHDAPLHTSILSRTHRWIVDEMTRTAWQSDADTKWTWRAIPFEGNLMVSNMTRRFAADILARGACELPTLQDSFPAHRFLLAELLPHFRTLLEHEIDRCPVV